MYVDRQTDRGTKGWTDMMKLTGAFHNYADMRKQSDTSANE